MVGVVLDETLEAVKCGCSCILGGRAPTDDLRLLRRPGSNLCLFQVSLRATVNKFIFSRLIEAVSSRDLHTCLLWGSGGAFRYFLSQAGQGEDSRRMMVEQPGWLFDRLNLARSQAKVQFYCWEPQSKGKTVSLEPHLNTSLFTRVLAVSAGSRGGAICALKWLALPIVSPHKTSPPRPHTRYQSPLSSRRSFCRAAYPKKHTFVMLIIQFLPLCVTRTANVWPDTS